MGLLSLGKKAVDIIDDLVSDKDLANQLKAEIVKIEAQELSKRHASDMASDSWLSKNVRPLVLIFLTVATVLLAYLTIFILSSDKVAIIEPWISLLTVLLAAVYAFYFGSRGFEKVQSIKRK